MYRTKPYNQELFNKHDRNGKKALRKLLESYGYTTEEGTQFGIDVIARKNGVEHRFDVEHRGKPNDNREYWHSGMFPFPTVLVAQRRIKSLKSFDIRRTWFCTICYTYSHAFIGSAIHIVNREIETHRNKHMKVEDCVYVPKKHFKLYDLRNL